MSNIEQEVTEYKYLVIDQFDTTWFTYAIPRGAAKPTVVAMNDSWEDAVFDLGERLNYLRQQGWEISGVNRNEQIFDYLVRLKKPDYVSIDVMKVDIHGDRCHEEL